MSTFFSIIDAHAQALAHMSRYAYSGGRRAYALRHAGAGERGEVLT